jgi:exodeoxyribonuclease VII small subunit
MSKLDFEQAMKRLETIVGNLEGGNLTLAESLKIFEEGVKLSQLCAQKLEEAEKKVEILLTGEDGKKKPQPFELNQQELFSTHQEDQDQEET